MFPGIQPGLFDDPEFKEDSVRELVIAPIVSRLGYLPSGSTRVIRSKALRHPYIKVGTRKHPVTLIPDYTFLHDKKPIFVLDAKGPNESVLDDHHVQQVYSYAIHPEIKCKEFGLCNGRQLAIFHTDQSAPLLVLSFEEYESRWSEIEKYLSPRYLLQPELRNFSPDFGFKLKRLGITQDIDLVMIGTRLNLFGRVSDALITASANCDLGGVEHCISFDFHPSMLKEMVAGLPSPLGDMFLEALSRAPFKAAAGLVIELDITARLGDETQGMDEAFIPLIIQKIHASRFNPSVVAGDRNDIPAHVFQLRKAFEVKEPGGDA
jgi:hypothetical protein